MTVYDRALLSGGPDSIARAQEHWRSIACRRGIRFWYPHCRVYSRVTEGVSEWGAVDVTDSRTFGETQLELEHRLARAPTDLRSFGEAELEVEHPDELAHLRSQIDSSAAQPDRQPTSSTPRASGMVASSGVVASGVESDHEAAGGAAAIGS